MITLITSDLYDFVCHFLETDNDINNLHLFLSDVNVDTRQSILLPNGSKLVYSSSTNRWTIYDY